MGDSLAALYNNTLPVWTSQPQKVLPPAPGQPYTRQNHPPLWTYGGMATWNRLLVYRDGNGLAYPHRTGFRPVSDRLQTGVRPVSQLTVRPVSDQCQVPYLRSPCHSVSSPIHRVHVIMSCQICGVMSDAQKCHVGSAECHFGCTVLTEIQESNLKVVRCWQGSGLFFIHLRRKRADLLDH